MTRELVLDTETTGLDYEAGHRLVEIGMLDWKIIYLQVTTFIII